MPTEKKLALKSKRERASLQAELSRLEGTHSGWSDETIQNEQDFNPELKRLLELRRLSKLSTW